MPRRHAVATQADITRAVKAAKAAGINVGRVDICPDGRIVVHAAGTQTKDDADEALAQWEADHGPR